ncbi:MAG: acyl--CoA ligase [Candidatus Omnitrophica bacterium]|nr:acyl--CoA ligase [Candidatus Omnitrophota bacterium]
MNFAEILKKRADEFPDKPAVIFHDAVVTFRQLKEISFQVACGLAQQGLKKGDKVAIFMPNIPEYIYSFLGVFLLRGICVPLDFMLTEEEIVNFINHSESKILIAQEKKGLNLSGLKEKCPSLKEIILIGPSWQDLLNSKISLPEIKIEPKDYSSIFYTSGSTGHPKGVMLSYKHFENPVKCFDYFLHPDDKDVLICPGIPFSHLGGLDYLLLTLYFGVTLILMERFHPLEFLKNMEKYKTTIFCIVPSMYVAILSLKEYDNFDLSSLRYAVVFGAPSSPVLLERFHKAYPNAYLLNGWGMTETAAPNSYLPTGTNTKEIAGTGKFLPGTEVKIVDGELWIKGEAVMAGYYKEPELTQEALTEDGWLKTGDIARCDEQGRYSIVGRKKEMIKVSGEIVFAPEVEEAIQRHPKVKEIAIIGIADELRGEVPKAFIVLKDQEKLEAEELRYFLRQHLAHFKIPHYFEFVPSLPKNRVGKIDKEALKGRAVN